MVRREKLLGKSEKRARQALTRLSRDDSSQMSGYQRLFVQSQGKAKQKQRMATTIGKMRLHANGCDYCIPSDTNRTS